MTYGIWNNKYGFWCCGRNSQELTTDNVNVAHEELYGIYDRLGVDNFYFQRFIVKERTCSSP